MKQFNIICNFDRIWNKLLLWSYIYCERNKFNVNAKWFMIYGKIINFAYFGTTKKLI